MSKNKISDLDSKMRQLALNSYFTLRPTLDFLFSKPRASRYLRRSTFLCILSGVFILFLGCSDDNETTTKSDAGTTKRDSQSSTSYDQSVSQLEDAGVTEDGTGNSASDGSTSSTSDSSTASCTYAAATANSGKICNPDSTTFECEETSEDCVYLSTATNGMCAGMCCPAMDKDVLDTENLCPVTDSATQLASCVLPLDEVGQYWACAYVCYVEDSEGGSKSYPSPGTDSDYSCEAIFLNDDGSVDNTFKVWLAK
jgi:hypothetical protein